MTKKKSRIECSNCGCLTLTRNLSQPYCDDCSRLMKLERKRAAEFNQITQGDYRIVSGGGHFRNGATFHQDQFHDMIKRGWMEPGAVVKQIPRGSLKVVLGDMYHEQRLERIE